MTLAKDSEEYIKFLLHTRNDAVEKAILAIYKRQTDDEKRQADTKYRNGVGFSGADARLGTYYAQYLLKGNRLTGNHMIRARGMAFKYVRQLCEIASQRVKGDTVMPEITKETLSAHRQTHTKENSHWMNDARGIPLCRVCDACEDVAKSTYRPEVLGESGEYEDVVEEQIEPD